MTTCTISYRDLFLILTQALLGTFFLTIVGMAFPIPKAPLDEKQGVLALEVTKQESTRSATIGRPVLISDRAEPFFQFQRPLCDASELGLNQIDLLNKKREPSCVLVWPSRLF